jgi:hypothetical protein
MPSGNTPDDPHRAPTNGIRRGRNDRRSGPEWAAPGACGRPTTWRERRSVEGQATRELAGSITLVSRTRPPLTRAARPGTLFDAWPARPGVERLSVAVARPPHDHRADDQQSIGRRPRGRGRRPGPRPEAGSGRRRPARDGRSGRRTRTGGAPGAPARCRGPRQPLGSRDRRGVGERSWPGRPVLDASEHPAEVGCPRPGHRCVQRLGQRPPDVVGAGFDLGLVFVHAGQLIATPGGPFTHRTAG